MRSILGVALLLLLVGCDALSGPESGSHADLTIRGVERLPRILPIAGGAVADDWPAPGSTVTWRAHVRNWAPEDRTVAFAWFLDGAPAGGGAVVVPGDGTAAVDLPWSWTPERHELRFEVDPDNAIEEEEEANNTASFATDALAVGFYVDTATERRFREGQQRVVGAPSTSFEDFARRHVERLNELVAEAIFPETPDGVTERFRLDRVITFDDTTWYGAIPPEIQDPTLDLWALPGWYGGDPAVRMKGSLLHELGHSRELIDVYGTQVFHDLPGHRVAVREGGELIAGTELLPSLADVTARGVDGQLYEGIKIRAPVFQGLMATEYTHLDRYSAAVLNRIAHRRFAQGEERWAFYMDELPSVMGVRLVDAAGGDPLAGAAIRVYRGTRPDGDSPIVYPRVFDDTADMALEADGAGVARFPSNPFVDGVMDMAPSVALVRVEHQGRIGYVFLDALLYNLAGWRGETDYAELELEVTLH